MPFSISWSYFPFLNICSGIMSLRLCQLTVHWRYRKDKKLLPSRSFCFSVAKLCLTLCGPMNCSTPGFPVLLCLQGFLKLVSIELVMPSNYLVLCWPFSSCPQSFPAPGSFPTSWLFTSGGESIGTSASASVLPVNTQGWFLLGLTCLISLLSKGF